MNEHPTTIALRRFALVLAGLGVVGTVPELLLLHHYNGKDQLIPFFTLGLSGIALIVVVIRQTASTIRALQVVMILTILSSGIGVLEHLKANARNAGTLQNGERFPTSINAIISGFDGFAQLLAPGVLVQVGLLGLAFTYRHPKIMNTSATREAPGSVASRT